MSTTTSFLMQCPQCGLTIPKGGPCAGCHWSENAEATGVSDQETVRAFAAGRQVHVRNYAIFMILTFATGLVGLLTAFMWFKAIYLGDVVAFVWIALFTGATGILGAMLAWTKKWFPIELNCPSCGIRLDELGTDGDHCPNCSARLK